MGVIAHEMGHQLCGMPDLYDTSYTNAGLGNFSLMAGGSWGMDVGEYQGTTPVSMDAWSREYLGWATPVTNPNGSTTLYPALNSNASEFKLVKTSYSTTEYFLAENRYPTGWDLGIRGMSGFGSGWAGGLLILHVDNAVGTNAYQSGGHQGVMPVQASTTACNMLTTTCRGDKTTLFYSGNNSNWGSSTTPSSAFYSGTASNFSVSSISVGGSPMTMTVSSSGGSLPPAATLVSPSGTITTTTPAYVWNAVSTASYYQLYVNDAVTGGKIITWYTAAQAGCGSGTGTCSVTPSTTLATGAGQWWIQTYNSFGYGPWSSPLSFNVQINVPPSAATLVSPSGTITTSTPTYVWNAVSTASYYQLYVNDAVTGGKIITWYTAAQAGCGSGTGTCSVTPSTTLATGAGQWWIQTYNSFGYGPWSSSMSFNVNPTSGFNEQFNGTTAPNWLQDSGSWSVANGWYHTSGIPLYTATSTYNAIYTNFDYQAEFWRAGCQTCANRLWFRASGSTSSGWPANTYAFQYVADGLYSVFLSNGGGTTTLQNWTTSSYINTGNAWNNLRVVINGSAMYFYINGSLVWSGSDSTLGSGRAGVGMYSDGTSGDGLWVDYAVLVPSFGTITDTIDPEQLRKNEEAMKATEGSPDKSN